MIDRRLWVIGASGLLGTQIAKVGRRHSEVLGVARSIRGEATQALDWTDEGSVRTALRQFDPTHIAVCAAWPHVDGCEADPKRSERENVRPLELLRDLASCPILFFSTDQVFDGSQPCNREEDAIHPLNVYARHKALGEALVLSRPGSLVVRTSWIFGPESARKNFVYRVVDAAQNGRPLRVPRNQVGCPTFANWLAESSLRLWNSGMTGVVHVSGSEAFSKADWARTVGQQLQLAGLEVLEVSAEEAGQVAPRPAAVILKSSRHALTQPKVLSVLQNHRTDILSV